MALQTIVYFLGNISLFITLFFSAARNCLTLFISRALFCLSLERRTAFNTNEGDGPRKICSYGAEFVLWWGRKSERARDTERVRQFRSDNGMNSYCSCGDKCGHYIVLYWSPISSVVVWDPCATIIRIIKYSCQNGEWISSLRMLSPHSDWRETTRKTAGMFPDTLWYSCYWWNARLKHSRSSNEFGHNYWCIAQWNVRSLVWGFSGSHTSPRGSPHFPHNLPRSGLPATVCQLEELKPTQTVSWTHHIDLSSLWEPDSCLLPNWTVGIYCAAACLVNTAAL